MMENVRRKNILDTEEGREALEFCLHRKYSKHRELLYKYYKNSNNISDIGLSAIEKLVNKKHPLFPSDTHCLYIYRHYQDAIKNGWSPDEN